MIHPIEKYKFYCSSNKVVAVSTYAGKTVRGVAKCDSRDEFDIEKGKTLAAARCNAKVAKKREKRAKRKYWEAVRQDEASRKHLVDMGKYFDDAVDNRLEADAYLDKLMKEY